MEVDLLGSGWISAHPIKRRGEPAQFGGRMASEPSANEPSTNEPPIGKATTGSTGAATEILATGGGRDALGPEAI